MRGVEKGQPPTNVQPKDQPKESFIAASARLRAELPQASSPRAYARARFNELHKPLLRDALMDEQADLCVYCERRLPREDDKRVRTGETPRELRIDHWIPIDAEPSRALEWPNLHLSCPSPFSCDEHKHEVPLGLPRPSELSYEDTIGYTSQGEMYPRSDPRFAAIRDALDAALGTPGTDEGVLNLNDPRLCDARKSALTAYQEMLGRAYPGRHLERGERKALAEQLLSRRPLPSYVSILVAWLLRDLAPRP